MIDIYIGKHQSSKKLSRKALILIISLVLVFCAAVGGTIAFMLINTDGIENNFIPAEVVVFVNENTTEDDRNAEIVFKDKTSDLSDTIKINQKFPIQAGYTNGVVTIKTKHPRQSQRHAHR